MVQKTKSDSKRTKETITITKPNYQRTTRLLKHLQNERDEVEYNLKVENSLALDESKKDKNLANLKKMKDAYFKLSEKIKLVNQYHEIVNNTIENKNRINNNNLQIGKNSAEKRLVFSEITQLMKTERKNLFLCLLAANCQQIAYRPLYKPGLINKFLYNTSLFFLQLFYQQ